MHPARSSTPRGFARMTPERRKTLASKGGRTSQDRGTAHQWTLKEARAAGKKSALLRQRGAARASCQEMDILNE